MCDPFCLEFSATRTSVRTLELTFPSTGTRTHQRYPIARSVTKEMFLFLCCPG